MTSPRAYSRGLPQAVDLEPVALQVYALRPLDGVLRNCVIDDRSPPSYSLISTAARSSRLLEPSRARQAPATATAAAKRIPSAMPFLPPQTPNSHASTAPAQRKRHRCSSRMGVSEVMAPVPHSPGLFPETCRMLPGGSLSVSVREIHESHFAPQEWGTKRAARAA